MIRTAIQSLIAWLTAGQVAGRFWPVLLLIWAVNCVLAVTMNFVAYLLLWPDDLLEELSTLIGLPIIYVTVLTFPIVRLDHMIIQAQARAGATLRRAAEMDFLTGVLNRRGVESAMRSAVAATRHGAVLILDLDHFKHVNDHYGHDAGDDVLAAVGQALRGCVRSFDLIGRLGGEEFVVFLPGVEAPTAREIAERMRRAVAAQRVRTPSAGETIAVTVSIGMLVFETPQRFEDLYARADAALYKAKQAGRNRVWVAERGMIQRAFA